MCLKNIVFSIAMSLIKIVVVGIATATMVIAIVNVARMLNQQSTCRPVEEEERDEGVMV